MDLAVHVKKADPLRQAPCLGGRVPRRPVQENAGALYTSSISGLEIVLAVKRGRLELPVEPVVSVREALAQHGRWNLGGTG